jgi:hypothetical protein
MIRALAARVSQVSHWQIHWQVAAQAMTRQDQAVRLSDADGSLSRLRSVMSRLPQILFVPWAQARPLREIGYKL